MERIDLNDMALFVATVQAGSLSRAAEQLRLPKSRLSRRLTALETALGSKLLDRGRSGVRLNELGEDFFHRARLMLDCAEQAVCRVRQSLDEPQGLLRLSLSLEMQRAVLEPHLADFLRRYSAVMLDVCVENRRVSLIQDGIDLAIRAGAPAQEDVVARRLGTLTFGLYAAPGYPAPTTTTDLAAHPLLHKGDGAAWRLGNGHEWRQIEAAKRVTANDAFLLAQLARDGAGVALLPNLPALTTGLARVLPAWATEGVPLYALYFKNRGFAPAVRRFVDWFAAVFQQESARSASSAANAATAPTAESW